VKVDGHKEALGVAEAAGHALDPLDGGVQPLGRGVGDRVLEAGSDVLVVAMDHPGHVFHRLQTAAHRPAIPAVKEPIRRSSVLVVPEPYELLFERPGPGGLEITPTRQRKESRFAPEGSHELRQRGHKPRPQVAGRVRIQGATRLLEANAIRDSLRDDKETSQILSYASVPAVEWVVLSNG